MQVKNILLILTTILLIGCNTIQPYDYSNFNQHKPKSIVIIPPLNESLEVDASYVYLSTISEPLAEKGYYVFPVAVVDQFLKENGLSSPAEMNKVPLKKIRQYIGADAVLYISIKNWGQSYKIVSSVGEVSAHLKLVDTQTGLMLWEGTAYARQSSDDGGAGLAGALISAVVTQVLSKTISDPMPNLSTLANITSFNHPQNGLPDGFYLQKQR